MGFFKPNELDKRLLDLLNTNCRLTLNGLSKKLGVSKQAISKKISFYAKENVLKYVSIIDDYKIGKFRVYLYIKLKKIEDTNYNRILKKLSRKINLGWIAELVGDYDLAISFTFKEFTELSRKLDYIFRSFGKLIKNKKVFFIKNKLILGYHFTDFKRNIIYTYPHDNIVKMSQVDSKIIELIQSNARFNYIDIAKKTNLDAQTIKKHLFRLQKDGVILSYGLFLNYSLLGYNWKTCIIDLRSDVLIETLMEFLSSEKRIPFISFTIDNVVIFDFISQNQQELRIFLEEIKRRFDDIILDSSLFDVNKVIMQPYDHRTDFD